MTRKRRLKRIIIKVPYFCSQIITQVDTLMQAIWGSSYLTTLVFIKLFKVVLFFEIITPEADKLNCMSSLKLSHAPSLGSPAHQDVHMAFRSLSVALCIRHGTIAFGDTIRPCVTIVLTSFKD